MNTNFLKSATLLTTGLLLSGGLMAQDTPSSNVALFSPASSFRTWSIGIHGGVTTPRIFIGRNDFTNAETEIGYGAFIKKQLFPSFGIRADYMRAKLKGDNNDPLSTGAMPVRPNFAFQTDINYMASISGEWSPANLNWSIREAKVMPFFTAGIGYMGYQPEVAATSSSPFTQYKAGSNDNIHGMFVPVGLGLKFALSPGTSLNLAYSMSFVDDDDLDGTYFNEHSDRFSYGNIGLEFALGDKTKPQLSRYNPVVAMQYDNMMKDQALRDQLTADLNSKFAAEQAANAAKLAQLQADMQKILADADGDGVSDYFDKCPGTPAGTKVDGSGCPLVTPAPVTNTVIITEEDRRIVAEAIKNLEFDFNKATIRPSSFASLNRVADMLVAKNFSLKLAGHTDNKGSDAYNLKLSKDRAESVKAYLVSKGANPSRIEAVGYGESQPIATNNTDAGRQKNRRVEFTLY